MPTPWPSTQVLFLCDAQGLIGREMFAIDGVKLPVTPARKVDTQWKLYCLVHNIEKLAHHGYAQ